MKRKISLSIAAVLVFLSGCGVGWQKKLTKDELLQYPTVIALAKDRYTNYRVSSGLSQWQQREVPGRSIASFRIVTTTASLNFDQQAFFKDMSGYCGVKGGTFMNMEFHNRARMNKLEKIYSYSSSVPKDYFECGPEGRGQVVQDWTKFNSSVCRKLYETPVNTDMVAAKYGNPPDYQCVKNDNVLFMFTMRSRELYSKDVDVFIRINEAKGEPMDIKSGRIDME
ncbi:MAG: hypothetical protein WC527_09045 [Candidatus Margulisiibacteriota bacterium]